VDGVGLRRKSTRSSLEAQNALPLILVAFSCRVAMVEPPVSYLESTVPAARACFAPRVLSLRPPYVLRYFLRTTTVMGRKKITGDELNARAKANGYKRGAHREEDSRRDRNKHKDDTKKDQDGALDRYV
jgi:hypothetical protein